MKFYRLKKILGKKAQYNMIFGERSNGKTYAVLEYAIDRYAKYHEQTAIIRRWQDDLKGKRGASLFDGHIETGAVERLTNGAWNSVYYYSGRWWLQFKDPDDPKNVIRDEDPFAFGFSISSMEHDKSSSFPNVTTVLFDEFLTRRAYLPDEFVLFMNCLSTIIRHRNNVKIFMCGNTVNQYCPYFSEMGLTHVKQMKPGDIDLYTYGSSDLRVAVEYCATAAGQGGKASDTYFAFDNPKLEMIKTGVWELDIYPHCPIKYTPLNVDFTFFILFNDEMLQCECVNVEESTFIYIHKKTTDLKNPDGDLIYSPDYDPRPNWRRSILRPVSKIEKKIHALFSNDKIFYQDNEVGDLVRNYVIWCGSKK